MRDALVLVDGEHHPPVLRAALDELAQAGTRPALAVVVGGGEKLAEPGIPPDLGVPSRWPASTEEELAELINELRPDVVVDLSGEPVVSPRRRLTLAAITLASGIPFEAPGLRYEPPDLRHLTPRATTAVVATGKRTGKTAVSGALARHALRRDRTPVILAMGRGGPAEPVVVPAGRELGPSDLLEIVAAGDHAASDFYEDAVTTGVATIGCRRVGDGPAGAVALSNVPKGIALAETLEADLVILEGSGAALPPCQSDAYLLVVPATVDVRELMALLPLGFVLADLVVVTFADTVSSEKLEEVARAYHDVINGLPGRDVEGGIARRAAAVPVVTVGLRPRPLSDVRGRRVFFATTAPESATAALVTALEADAGAHVVGVTNRLSDRPRLEQDLREAPAYDVLLTELKAAAVDVAVRSAFERGREIVFCDNEPVATAQGDRFWVQGMTTIDEAFDHLLAVSSDRHQRRSAAAPAPTSRP